jgi:gag-polypeptide of LTR copia-type
MSQLSDNTKLTTLILNGNKNYIPWSRSVTIGLGGKGKLGFVTSTKEKPKSKKLLQLPKRPQRLKNGRPSIK